MAAASCKPLNEEERAVYHEMKSMEKRSFTRINSFQDNIAQGRPNQWRCRAGARYSTSARTGWCTTAPSSEDIRLCRWKNTRWRTSAASSSPKNLARRTARFRACTRYRFSIHGARPSSLRRPSPARGSWFRSSRADSGVLKLAICCKRALPQFGTPTQIRAILVRLARLMAHSASNSRAFLS